MHGQVALPYVFTKNSIIPPAVIPKTACDIQPPSFCILLQLLLSLSQWLIFFLWLENQTRVSDHEAIHGTKNHSIG